MKDPLAPGDAPTLVFDVDGTLAETAPDLMKALNFILVEEGIPPLPLAAARRLLGAGGRALIQRGYAEYGRTLDAAKLEKLFVKFLAFYDDHIADESRLMPGVAECLERSAKAGWRLAVCTNKLDHSTHLLLDKLGVHDRFAFICGQDTFGVGKPNPKPLIETIRRAGGDVARAVMVGDSHVDVDIARAAGTRVVLVDFGYTDKPAAELGADRVISHFDALPAAAETLIRARERLT